MTEVALIISKGSIKPYAKEDHESIKGYNGKLVKAKISGVKDTRSYLQLKTYFRCCRAMAENTEHPDFNTMEKTDYQLRIKHGWVKHTVNVFIEGKKAVQFIPKSLNYKEMSHPEACNYISEAIKTIAESLGCTEKELIECAE